MNAEIAKIRKIRNYDEIFEYEPKRIKQDRLDQMIYELNSNMATLYSIRNDDNVKVETYINQIIANIYIILNMFNEMGVYPDYFYDEIVNMNKEYKKTISGDKTIRGNYRLFNESNLAGKIASTIRKGLKNGHYRYQAYQKKSIDEAFLEMVSFFQAFEIPFNNPTIENCRKVFNEVHFNHLNIVEELYNNDQLFEDVESLTRLLFEYIAFFVSIGVYPKEYLDNYIDAVEKGKHK